MRRLAINVCLLAAMVAVSTIVQEDLSLIWNLLLGILASMCVSAAGSLAGWRQ